MKKICVVVGSRANYSSIKSLMSAVQKHDALILQTVVGASAILEKYGRVERLIEEDGFNIDARFNMILEGEDLLSMTKSTGIGLMEISSIFHDLQPDFVVTVGDRYETMATTIAASYMNIPLVHTMGGEVTGTIDESIRHATTKFAHLHFVATEESRERVIKMGEHSENVYNYGCPRLDLVAEKLKYPVDLKNIDELKKSGIGQTIDWENPFILVSQHPVTTEYGYAEDQIWQTLKAVEEINIQAIVLWPNSDAGGDHISKGIRKWREYYPESKMRFFKNLSIDTYIMLMDKTVCLVGNSSSGIREGAFIGTPVVNIGTRQNQREHGKNVISCSSSRIEIKKAIDDQIKHGKYLQDPIYGLGNAGSQIADILASRSVNIQKTITY